MRCDIYPHRATSKSDPEEEKAKKIAALAKAHPELRIGPTGQTYKEAWKQRHGKAKR